MYIVNVYEQILEFCVFKCELYFDFESQCIWSNGSDYELIYKTKLKKKNYVDWKSFIIAEEKLIVL